MHLPILRHGEAYRSLDVAPVPDVRGGAPLAEVSLANPALLRRDVARARAGRAALATWRAADRIGATEAAADLFLHATLPVGDSAHGPEDHVAATGSSTGLPHTLVRENQQKLAGVLRSMGTLIRGLTRGLDPAVLDTGLGDDDGVPVAYLPRADALAAVLPSNSPGVHSLWLPAPALGVPVVLKPGSGDPWTPLRLIAALQAAGLPAEAFGFYPAGHDGGAALIDAHDRVLVFGGAETVRRYADRPGVEVHGPGWSKILLDHEAAERWPDHLDLLATSVARNGGRSCINASTVVTARHADALADALAAHLAALVPATLDDPAAGLAAFADPAVARAIDATIARDLPGAVDVSAPYGPRLATLDGLTFLRPTVVRCPPDHPLAQREFSFPFVAVVELDPHAALAWMEPTLVLTLLSGDAALRRVALAARQIDRLHLGPIPTTAIRWDQPHEGNLFEWLYRRRAIAV